MCVGRNSKQKNKINKTKQNKRHNLSRSSFGIVHNFSLIGDGTIRFVRDKSNMFLCF